MEAIDETVDDIELELNEGPEEEEESARRTLYLDALRRWALDCNLPHTQLTKLLKIQKNFMSFQIPTTAATLLKIPKVPREIIAIDSGHAIYMGIENCLLALPESVCELDVIRAQFGIDGFQQTKSKSTSSWPIIMYIIGSNIQPFPIHNYIGRRHPKDLNKYLEKFAAEVDRLQKNGVLVSSKKILKPFSLHSIVTDTKGRCFVAGTRDNAFRAAGCHRCDQVSITVNGRAVFTAEVGQLRTDESFYNRVHPNHHNDLYKTIATRTVIERIGIKMISQIPLDTMHLVELGVMKKILELLMGRLVTGFTKDAETLLIVDSYFQEFFQYTPGEFQRKPRTLFDHGNFKATECRQFLLYSGIVLLKSFLSPESYKHFLSLSIAYRILNTNSSPSNCQFARSLLQYFVSNYHVFYDIKNRGYNVHGLLHVVDDCERFGIVNNFSAYKFENAIGHLKPMKRSDNKVLEQFANRTMEKIHYNGFKQAANKKGYKFKVDNTTNNCCFVLNDNKIIWVQNIKNNVITAKYFTIKNDFFLDHVKSSTLGIYLCDKLSAELIIISLDLIKNKCYMLPYFDEDCKKKFVCIPLIHGEDQYGDV